MSEAREVTQPEPETLTVSKFKDHYVTHYKSVLREGETAGAWLDRIEVMTGRLQRMYHDDGGSLTDKLAQSIAAARRG